MFPNSKIINCTRNSLDNCWSIYKNNFDAGLSFSFNLTDLHHYDIGSIIDNEGIAVRTGHHCAQPIMDYYKISGTIRISLSFYNTKQEIDSLIDAIIQAKKMLT